MMHRASHLLRFLLAASAPAGAAQAQDAPVPDDLPVVEHRLDNGMTFLVLPRPGAPTVAIVVQYAVGGVNAEAVLFERMDALHDSALAALARSPVPDTALARRFESRIRELEDSARVFVRSNELDRILTRNGARNLNATTDNESTTYFIELPSNRTRLWFTLEADRMRNPVFREFYTERDVVTEERRMRVDDDPGGLLYEAHLAAAFQMHPYGVPVVGYMSDLTSLGRKDVESYYRRYYGPNNAVVAIVGDVRPDTIRAWADAYFAGVPRGETPPPVLAVEPEQRGERRIRVLFDAEPQLRIGWHTGSVFDDDAPALAMLSYLLTGGRTGRLYRRLVLGDRLATFVGASTVPGSRYPRLFTVQAAPRAPHTVKEVEAAIYEEIDRLARTPPEARELERVRRQLEASDVRRLTSNLGLAFQLAGSASLLGDWRATFALSRRMRDVTPLDVQRVARTYFHAWNRTVAVLEAPAPADEANR
jgi:predicted Zn-dependent peptidase